MKEELSKKKNGLLPVWARIVLVLISYLLLSGIFQLVGMIVLKIPFSDMEEIKNLSGNNLLILQIFGFLALVIIVYIFRRFIDKESIKSMGFSFNSRLVDIGIGFLIALLIIGGSTLLLYISGYIDFLEINVNIGILLLNFILFIIVAFNEEILFRGYLLNNLLRSNNKYVALAISAILFALMHGMNFNLSILSFVNLLLAGILLGSTYIYFKNLWLPISLHLFWNFLQGSVFGYAVSGLKTDSMITLKLNGSSLMNGGEFGFEGSILCSVAIIVTIGVIFYYNIKREKVLI